MADAAFLRKAWACGGAARQAATRYSEEAIQSRQKNHRGYQVLIEGIYGREFIGDKHIEILWWGTVFGEFSLIIHLLSLFLIQRAYA